MNFLNREDKLPWDSQMYFQTDPMKVKNYNSDKIRPSFLNLDPIDISD